MLIQGQRCFFSFILADIIVVDPILHRHSFTESPPNEFRFQEHDPSNMSTPGDDDNDLLGQSHVNVIPDAEQSVPTNKPASSEHRNSSPVLTTTAPTNESRTLFDGGITFLRSQIHLSLFLAFVEKVHQVILRLFEIKRSDKVKIDRWKRLLIVALISRRSFWTTNIMSSWTLCWRMISVQLFNRYLSMASNCKGKILRHSNERIYGRLSKYPSVMVGDLADLIDVKWISSRSSPNSLSRGEATRSVCFISLDL